MKTTVIGSYPKIPNYPREERIRKALHQLDKKEITLEQLEKVFQEETLECMREMEKAGVDLITDGQLRWSDEITYFAGRLENVELNGLTRFFNNNTYYRQPVINGKMKWKETGILKDFEFAGKNAKKELKISLPGPHTLAYCALDKSYEDFKKIAKDFAKALNKEMKKLEKAGAKYIQLNEPFTSEFYPNFIEIAFKGVKAKRFLWSYFYDVPETFFDCECVEVVGLDFVEGKKNFDYLKKGLLGDRELGVGIIDGRNTKMETFAQIEPQIRKIEDYVSCDMMWISPNTGLDFLPRENADAKLKNMVEIIKRI